MKMTQTAIDCNTIKIPLEKTSSSLFVQMGVLCFKTDELMEDYKQYIKDLREKYSNYRGLLG